MEETRKIVINTCYGGFGLSEEAATLYFKLKGLMVSMFDIPRDDPNLVEVVETLKDKANGFCADLKVVEIPADVEWHISEYDGIEEIHEGPRRWR